MNDLEKRFLLDSRFTGNEKLICFLVWSNDFELNDQQIINSTQMSYQQIKQACFSLIEKKVITTTSIDEFTVTPLKDIYG
jgi:hypothetical protein